jgi:hypothetical protein
MESLRPSSAPERSAAEWETLVGGNWLNKLGVFILVIGIALALGYSFTRIGPAGRVAASLAVSLAMLAAGVVWERRERYRVFARGLIGGGWAALYFTVYAMHAIAAAQILDNAFAAAVLLFSVAAGMIAHSLRYRSQAVTGLAYTIAFATLAIAEANVFAALALVPLAASLLVIAHRFRWSSCAVLALVATYAVCVFRGDTGAPLWQAQTLFAVFWLLFEAFDVVLPDPRLLPLNAAGFLGLSLVKWSHAAPLDVWQFLAAAAAAYLASAIVRSRGNHWRRAITISVVLAAGSILLQLDPQPAAFALVAEAEVLYLAGLAFDTPYLRRLATGIFAVQLLQFFTVGIESPHWRALAALNAIVFYGNRALCRADVFFSYAGAGLAGLALGYRVPHRDPALALTLSATVPFCIGWRWRLSDFRYQAYLLAGAGIVAMALPGEPLRSLGIAATLAYSAALCGRLSREDRFVEDEPAVLRLVGSAVCVGLLAALTWRATPDLYRGVAWMAAALALLELGVRRLPDELRPLSYALAVAGAIRVLWGNLLALQHAGPLESRLIPVAASILAYAFAARAALPTASVAGTVFAVAASWALLPIQWVGAEWAILAVALQLFDLDELRWQGYAVAFLAFFTCCLTGLPVAGSAVAIATFYGLQLKHARDSGVRLYHSILATLLLGVLLFDRVSGSLLTIAWGAEGLLLLIAGFPLRDRIQRLSGMALLLVCILKLFVYDLRFLDTLPRIFSFIALGLILVAVSWIYTRFREKLERFL